MSRCSRTPQSCLHALKKKKIFKALQLTTSKFAKTAPDAKKGAILKQTNAFLLFEDGGGDCFQIIVSFACSTYSFVNIIIIVIIIIIAIFEYLLIKPWVELISIGLKRKHTINPMFTGSWLSPTERCQLTLALLHVTLLYSKKKKKKKTF